jgi:lipopolysaccharide export LptBFGC system permease protein LptF
MKGIKRVVGLGVAGILLLTILTNSMAAPTTQSKNDKKETSWKTDKQDIHKGKEPKLPEKGTNLHIPQDKRTSLPFDKNMNTNNEVKKARPGKSDAIK